MSGIYRIVRKIWLITVMMLIPGCLDSTPESLDGVDISILAESFVEGDSIQFMASGNNPCLLYTSPSPRDRQKSRMPSSA